MQGLEVSCPCNFEASPNTANKGQKSDEFEAKDADGVVKCWAFVA